uniref:uncharacterized protein LOC124022062 isoform X7 n=1 Tax=Oncorhynchus gorbuscha TaxID=8017 RepID=UPI001EAF3B21|nr:uncharacterized protein LOC124022062 isoform X7 [Oncorhynchus gorbuscha]
MFLITGTETCKSLSQGPELKQVIQVDSGKDAVLECSVNFNGISPGNVNIEKVVWWRLDQNGLHKGEPVFKCNMFNQQSFNPRLQLNPKYQLPIPPANEKDKVVSLLVKETQPEDEGPYECVVNTDSGITNCNFMLNVTVRDQHQVPGNVADKQEIPKNSYMSVAAVCVVVGSLAIGLLLLKLFQARRLRQGLCCARRASGYSSPSRAQPQHQDRTVSVATDVLSGVPWALFSVVAMSALSLMSHR